MPRLFLGNFDFEHRLAEPFRQTPARLERLNAELASVWLSIADDGDWIWTPSTIDDEFFARAVRDGMPRVICVTSFHEVPAGTECVPWGWSSDLGILAQKYGWSDISAPAEAIVWANSRATSNDLEREWNVGLEGSRQVGSLEDLESAIRSLNPKDAPWIVKAEFGMSARECIRGRGLFHTSHADWLRRRLRINGRAFFEPWVERLSEVGIQIDIPRQGLPQLVGLTPMLVDARGQYAGSWFSFSGWRFEQDQTMWSEAVEVGLRAAEHLQDSGYFGPLGIDAMIYRDQDGDVRLRPLQDINARWTMGRLSLGWKRILPTIDEGCWQHGSVNNLCDLADLIPAHILPTSPELVGGLSCHHQSRILIR